MPDKVCVNCDNDKTYIDRRGYEHWRYDGGNCLCRMCFDSLIGNQRYTISRNTNAKKYQDSIRFRRLRYKDRFIIFPFDIICGVCNWCRNVLGIDTKSMHRHHDEGKYNDENPLMYTIEICATCHLREGVRLGQIDIRGHGGRGGRSETISEEIKRVLNEWGLND